MRRRVLLLVAAPIAILVLFAGGLALDSPRAAAQPPLDPPPCFVPLFTAASGNALAICPNVPPCAGTITVTVVGPPGTVGVVNCGGVQASCTVVFLSCTANSAGVPPGAFFACGVVKPAGLPPAFAFCTG